MLGVFQDYKLWSCKLTPQKTSDTTDQLALSDPNETVLSAE